MFAELSAISPYINEVILSLSLFLIAKELKWKTRWKAWIPGLRMYCLGASP